jgi:aspartate aminotransferase
MSRLPIAKRVAENMESASWIREMFERGLRLKQQLGADNVFDLSLGNPSATPPDAFFEAARAVAGEFDPGRHRYMPNAGFLDAREAVARYVRSQYPWELDADSVVLTTGAAGGLNVTLRAICDPGDEVLIIAPYFPEYLFYIEQAGAMPVVVESDREFQPDIAAIEAAVTPRTRAIIVNSPNNPTGIVYTKQRCDALSKALVAFDSAERPIYLLADDPYRRIVFDEERAPSVGDDYERTVLISSYSKDLSIAGERAGYIAAPTRLPGREMLIGALTMLNRTLGFVNMPAMMQRIIARCAGAMCDISEYRRNRDTLCHALREFGYELAWPGGAMFAFPRTPINDDVKFSEILVEQKVLTVPGRGFGRAGHFRASFAVPPSVIDGALPGFKHAIEECRGRYR